MFNVYFRVRVFTFAFAVDELEDRNDVKCCVCFFFFGYGGRLMASSLCCHPRLSMSKLFFFPFHKAKGEFFARSPEKSIKQMNSSSLS